MNELDFMFVLKGKLKVTFQPLVAPSTHKESQLSKINKDSVDFSSEYPHTPEHAPRQ